MGSFCGSVRRSFTRQFFVVQFVIKVCAKKSFLCVFGNSHCQISKTNFTKRNQREINLNNLGVDGRDRGERERRYKFINIFREIFKRAITSNERYVTSHTSRFVLMVISYEFSNFLRLTIYTFTRQHKDIFSSTIIILSQGTKGEEDYNWMATVISFYIKIILGDKGES